MTEDIPIHRKWFTRLGEIPGMDYDFHPSVLPARLLGHGLEPELVTSDIGGESREVLWWRTVDGQTTASPVSQVSAKIHYLVTEKQLLANVYQGLELPGEPLDYHFLIQRTIERLWEFRTRSESARESLVRLCRLDVDLIQALPEHASTDLLGYRVAFVVQAFPRLIALYEEQGLVGEALEIAKLATLLGQKNVPIERLTAQLDPTTPTREEVVKVLKSWSNPIREEGTRQLRQCIELALGTLTSRERMITQMRFGLSGGGQRSWRSVAAEFEISTDRARNIGSCALDKLRWRAHSADRG